MSFKTNRLLLLMADMHSIKGNDKLANMIEDENNELSESELELVSAAGKSDYEKFKTLLELNSDK